MSGSKSIKFRLLLDTSAFLLIFEGVDIFEKLEDFLKEPVEFYTLQRVVDELKQLSQRFGSRRGRAARLALTTSMGKVKVIPFKARGPVDDAIIDFLSAHPEYILVTLDADLRRRAKEIGVRTITWWAGKRRFSKG